MFEQYLLDAFRLYQKSSESEDEVIYLRSVIFHLASAVEAYINELPSAMEGIDIYSKVELDFLSDKTQYVIPQKGIVQEKMSYNSIKDKIKFLAKKHHRAEFPIVDAPIWSRYSDFKDFRDKLVHPREGLEDVDIQEYRKEAKNGLKTIVELLNLLSQSIYRRKLRNRILEMAE